MAHKFVEIAFTPSVKAVQERQGTRQIYSRYAENGLPNDTITPDIAEFVTQRESFYLGTTGSNGYPYIQFRGGKPGFLKVLDEKTLGFADFRGNVQYITVGNLADNDKAFIFLMDYRHRRRLKIWGRAWSVEDDPTLLEQLKIPSYNAEIERAILFRVEACSWNCPQHIPMQYSEQEVEEMVAPLKARIEELENLLLLQHTIFSKQIKS